MIPQWRGPKFRENLPPCVEESHRLDPADTTICFASRPRSPLGFFRKGYESNLGCIYRDCPWNSRPATAGTNSSDRQQFLEFPAQGFGERNSENICPRLQREKKNEIIHLEDVAVLGRRGEGDRPLLGPEPNESGAGQQFSEFRFQQAMSTGRRCRILLRLPDFRRCIAQEKRLTRRVQIAGCRLAYFA